MAEGLGQAGVPRVMARAVRERRIFNFLNGRFDLSVGDGLTLSDGLLTASPGTANIKSVKLKQTTNQSLPNAAATAVQFSDGAEHDSSGGWYSAGANTKVTVDAAALFFVHFGAKLTLSGACSITLEVKKNGSVTVARMHVPSTTAGNTEISGPAMVQSLAASDFLELYVTQDTGGVQTIDEATLAVTQIGAV